MESPDPLPVTADVQDFQRRFDDLRANIESFVQGKREVVSLALTCLFAEGHLLIEDVPGVAKTSLARALARSLSAKTRRIQFTPDLLPTDITGVRIYDLESRTFRFEEGPVFANIVIGDEINRASPKTQSALLEVMAERQVTVDGVPRVLPRPFLCIATQNPIDQQGTYALPEAQLDRFMMRIRIGYPSLQDEILVLDSGLRRRTPNDLSAVMDLNELAGMFDLVQRIAVAPDVLSYLALLVRATRDRPGVRLGVSPRGGVALAVCSQARAASMGRHFVTIDDVKALAIPVLAHRIMLSAEAIMAGQSAERMIESVLAEIPAVLPAGSMA